MLDYEIFNPYEGLIFDMDGTLIDTMPVHAQAWTMVGKKFGYEFDFQIMYNSAGRRFELSRGNDESGEYATRSN